MSLRYEGYYDYDGFQLVYFQADPGKPVSIYIFNEHIFNIYVDFVAFLVH